MQLEITTGGLVAAATTSNKKVNQDAFAIARNPKVPLTGVIVADGLGSHYGSEIASNIAAASFKDALEQVECSCGIHVSRLFGEAQRRLADYVDSRVNELPHDLDWRNAFGTTVLSAIETSDEILIGYLGNGAIFHIRGNFNTFPASQLLPWTAVNYLNPHSLSRCGKNVLYKLLSARSVGEDTVPTVVTVCKDLQLFGDIVLVCSDGIYSYDQTAMGKDDEGQIWISGEATMSLFFEVLKAFFAGRAYTEEVLQASLEEYLSQLRLRNLVTDDCTLGVLITATVIRYQQNLWLEQTGESQK